MSTTVDNRVVEMQFDNKHFENNVATSMSTLDKLKKSLNLDSAAKGLNGITRAAKQMDISPVGKAAETVGLKFNSLYTVADQALRNITNSAVNYGKRIISALTLDPVKTGFNEYETKIGSIQTIMSNTASKGTTMADVTRVIDELNTYADKTIYNFAEMTRNIGTFTAAGVGLEESAAAIQGIANLAASSGSTSQQASTAMYQLSQALAAGTVKLMDWNSVVNAGMGGEKFQEALKATARDHGVAVDKMIDENGSFRESLQEGWITADILNETLNKFTVDGAKNYAKSMMESGKWTQKQADDLVKEAQAMEDAATKVKTFTQLWDTMKESAQSGWGKTWELIVGDFEEAKTLWTGVSNVLGGMIEKSADARNDMLEGALSSNWEKLTKKINEAGIETADFEANVKHIAEGKGKDVDALVAKYGSLEKVFQKDALSSDILKEALGNIGDKMVDITGITEDLKYGMSGEQVRKMQSALDALGYDLGAPGVDGIFKGLTQAAVEAFQKDHDIKVTGIVDEETLAAIDKAITKTKEFDGNVDDLIDNIDTLGGREKLLLAFKRLFLSFKNIATPIGKAFREMFPRTTSEQISNLIDGFLELSTNLGLFLAGAKGQTVIKGITTVFKGLFAVIKIGLTAVKEIGSVLFKVLGSGFTIVGGAVLKFAAAIGEGLIAIKEWIDATGFIPALVDTIGAGIQNGVAWIKEFTISVKDFVKDYVAEFGGIGGLMTSVFGAPFGVAIEKLGEFIDRMKDIKKFDSATISAAFADFKTNVIEYFKKIDLSALFESFIDGVKNFSGSVKDHFAKIGGKFGEVIGKIVDFGTAIREYLGRNMGGIIAAGGLFALFAFLKKFSDMLQIIAKPLDVLDDLADGLKSLGKTLKFSVKTVALKNIAVSLAILAASLVALALLPVGKLWSAVAALAVVAGVLAGVIFVLSKVSDNIGDMAKLSSAVLMLAGSILVFAAACKIIAGIENDSVGKCLILIGSFAVIVAAMMVASKRINDGDMVAFGTMMTSLAGALLIFSVAVRILGRMDTGTLLKGGLAILAFLAMMKGMMKATSTLGKDMPKFATTMAGLAGALLLFTVSVGILGNMDTGTLLQGGLAILVFLGMMKGMMKATSALGKDIPKFGATMLGMSVGVLALAATAKILAGIDSGDLVKGGLVIATFLLMMKGMMKATNTLGKNSVNSAKFGLMMLSFAGAMILLTGAIAILSAIEPANLVKAELAIAGIAAIFGALTFVNKFAKSSAKVGKNFIMMAVSIGILAAAVAALSLIDSTKLKGATAALSTIIAMFAVLTASTKLMGAGGVKSIAMLVTLTGIVALLAYVLKSLSDMPADSALGVSKALSTLIVSLSASCLLLAAVGSIGPAAFIGVAVLAALMAVIGIFAAVAVAALPTVGSQLSEFMTNLQPFLEGAKQITPEMGQGLKTLGEALGVLTRVGFANAISFGLPFKQFSKDMALLADGISEFNDAVSGDDFNPDRIKAAAEAASELAGVSAKVSDSKGLLDWIATFKGKDSAFETFGKDLIPVAKGLLSFNNAVTGDDFNVEKIKAAATAASELAGVSATVSENTGFLEWISTMFGGGSAFENFGEDLIPVANGLVKFNEAVTGDNFDVDKIKSAATAASKLADVSATVTEDKGLLDWISTWTGGGSAFENFGNDLIPVANGLVKFNEAVTGDDFSATKITSAAEAISELANSSVSVTESKGLLDWMSTLNGTGSSFENFGNDLIPVANGLVAFNEAVTGDNFDADKIKAAATAASELAGVAVTTSDAGGLFNWISSMNGKSSSFENFGNDLIPVANGLVKFNEAVTGDNFDADKIKAAATAAAELAGVSVTVSEGTGFLDWMASWGEGGGSLDGFASNLGSLGGGLAAFSSAISGANLNAEQMTSATDALDTLAGIGGDVAENSSGWDWLTGKDSLGDFGTNLETLGGCLATFSTKVSGKDFDMSSVSSAITEVSNLATVAGTVGGENVGKLTTFGYEIQSLGQSIGQFYNNISKVDAGKLSGVAGAISALASVNVDNADTLQSFIDSLGNVGTSGIDQFVSAISDSTPKILAAAASLMNSFVMGMVSKAKSISTIINGIMLSAVASTRMAYPGFFSSGGYLVAGFAAGITANTFKATVAAYSMAMAAKRAVQLALGIKSPAREMIAPGKFTAEGFAKGILSGISTVYNAGLTTAEYAKEGFSSALSSLSDMVANDIDTEPTIRPVLDLSDVSSGASRINGMLSMNPSIGAMANVTAISSMMSKRQNGPNGDVVSAINDLGKRLGGATGPITNNYVNGVNYSNDDAVGEAIGILVRAATMEGRA